MLVSRSALNSTLLAFVVAIPMYSGTIDAPFLYMDYFGDVQNGNTIIFTKFLESTDPTKPISINQIFTGAGYSMLANGSALADKNGLHASIAGTFATSTGLNGGGAMDAGFLDNLLISDSLLTGQNGLLNVAFSLDGTISGLGSTGFVQACVNKNPFANSTFDPVNCRRLNPSPIVSSISGNFELDGLPFVYGQPFDFTFQLVAGVNFIAPGSGSSDFGDTLKILSLTPLDAQGQVVTGTQISSALDASYAVPERSSVFLMGLGLAGLVGMGIARPPRDQTPAVSERATGRKA